mmetsp:Transcript_43387/g.80804  ORF Transcript_43387/g.80804 Transcript_43387/m.80804 type:complete len:612 (-) Transcript_43387:73-1908(-)
MAAAASAGAHRGVRNSQFGQTHHPGFIPASHHGPASGSVKTGDLDKEEKDKEAVRKKMNSKIVERLEALDKEMKTESNAPVPWIKTPKADAICGSIILLNTAFIGVDLELGGGEFNWGLWAIETVFLIIFVVEIALRLRAEWPKLRNYFDSWGIFDTFVTVTGCIDAWIVTPAVGMGGGDGSSSPMSSFTILRVFRLVRLARLIRVLRMFHELVLLVQTLGNSIRAVGWMSLLLGMIIYTGSVICVMLLGEPMRDENEDINTYFGTLGDAIFSHFCVVTLEGWPDVAMAAMQQSPLWALYFVAIITLTNFALVNLMVGVIVERIIHYSIEQENELSAFVAESEQFRVTLKTLFEQSDVNHDGTVTREEIRNLMEDPRTHEIMNAWNINLDIPTGTLFTIMDLHRDGPTTFEEFFNACMRLCGSKQNLHSIFLQHDIAECKNELRDRLSMLENHLSEAPRAISRPTGNATAVVNAASSPGRPAGSNGIADAPKGAQVLSPEDAITELLERMDRFGQVQMQIFSEIESIKEQAGLKAPGFALSQGNSPDREAVLQNSKPKDLGHPCCIDNLFSRRQDPQHPGRRDKELRQLARKELEAEFRRNKRHGADGRMN